MPALSISRRFPRRLPDMLIKRALAALLLLSLLCLAACGDVPEAAETPAPLPAVEPSPAPSPAAEEKVFSRGRIEGQVYESGFLGLRFTAPEGWTFAADGELAQRMGLSMDIVGEDVFGDAAARAEAIAQQAVVYDMAACAPDSSANVLISVEDPEVAGSAALSEEEYAALLRQQLLSLTDLRYETEEPARGTLAGRPCAVLTAFLRDYGMTQRFYLLREGRYMVSVVLTGTENALPDADELFSAL